MTVARLKTACCISRNISRSLVPAVELPLRCLVDPPLLCRRAAGIVALWTLNKVDTWEGQFGSLDPLAQMPCPADGG